MKKVKYRIICMIIISTFFVLLSFGAQAKDPNANYKYIQFISINISENSDERQERLSELGDDPLVDMDKYERAILLFREAQEVGGGKKAQQALEYFDEIYQNVETLRNPIVLAWIGVAEANWGGAISKPMPSKKIKLLTNGIAKMDDAIQELSRNEKENYLGIGYIVFLRGTVLASAPEFLEITEEGKKNLRTALYYFKKAKLTKQYGDLIASVYISYSTYYIARGKISAAQRSLNVALKAAYTSQMKERITIKKELLGGQ